MWQIEDLKKLKTDKEYIDFIGLKFNESNKLNQYMFHELKLCIKFFINNIERGEYGKAEYWVGKGEGILFYFYGKVHIK